MKIRENISLVIGIALPVLMIIAVVASIYVPRWLSNEAPQYNFLYMSSEYYGGGEYRYFVREGRLVREEHARPPNVPRDPSVSDDVRFFLYDVTEHENRELTFEEASQFQLDSASRSPDGFEIVPGTRTDFPFFVGQDHDRRFLRGKYYSHELDLVTIGNMRWGMHGVTFLGWVLEEGQEQENSIETDGAEGGVDRDEINDQ